MLAYYVHDLSPFLIRFNEVLGVRWYGLAYVTGFLLGIVIIRHLSRRGWCDIPEAAVSDFIIGAAIFGVLLGGRLGYMLFYDFDNFIHNPLIIVRVWDGGMSAHGGMLGLLLYTSWYARRHKISWLNICDNLVVAAPLGLFFGRLANFINGELYGRITHVAWAMQFPGELRVAPPGEVERALNAATALNPTWNNVDVIIESARHSAPLRASLGEILEPRHPSQLYEAALEGGLLFTLLWLMRTRLRLPNGILAGTFLIGYAIVRSTVELFREPDSPLVGSLTRGQFLSIFLVFIGLIYFLLARLRPSYPRGRPA